MRAERWHSVRIRICLIILSFCIYLQRAQHLFPNSPEINWRLANFYVRQDKIPEGLQALGTVLTEDSTAGRRVFTLATNATRNREAVLETLPPQAAIFFDYLNFQIERNDVNAAEDVWTRILQLHLPFDLPRFFAYLMEDLTGA